VREAIPTDCVFYQAIELPGIGLIEGSWDHRHTADDYLGQLEYQGRRVLDVGPANGFFTFEMERRGAEVTALDLGTQGEWDSVPHSFLDVNSVRANLQENVRRVENAFWFAHQRLQSNAKLVHGSVYDTPALVQPVETALMGNVLQHVRDPFRAIEQVAKVVADTIVISEAVWHDDEAFLTAEAMWLIPRADTPYCTHSWWQVSPAMVTAILRILGFPQISLKYHQQRFVGSESDRRARMVKHFTVVGTRPGERSSEAIDASGLQVLFPAEGWHAGELGTGHWWRWSRDKSATVRVHNHRSSKCSASVSCGIATLQADRVELYLNGSMIWSGDTIGFPIPLFVRAVTLNPGANTLEFRARNEPSQPAGDPRVLGLAVYDLTISAEGSDSQGS